MFRVAAEAYDRFMGKYSTPLAPQLADFAGVAAGQRVLDVGCGPGALTAELVRRVGADAVAAVEPSEPFAAAARGRNPGVEVVEASAERLPFADAAFDAALAQLVVHFTDEPVVGLREMARVVRPGGVVAASVWDYGGGADPLSLFWDAARRLGTSPEGESRLAGARRGHLVELLGEAGLREVEETALTVTVGHETFDEWWEPFTLSVGPAGAHLATLHPSQRERLRDLCFEAASGRGPTVTARAWAARGLVGG